MKATGWQPHSVRGFLSGTLRKKLGVQIDSAKRDDKERTYRISSKDVPSYRRRATCPAAFLSPNCLFFKHRVSRDRHRDGHRRVNSTPIVEEPLFTH